MTRIVTFIAADRGADAVVDASAWAGRRLDLPVEFVHVIDRHPERARAADYSGAIGIDAQQDLLRLLAEQDARLSVALRDAGRELLARARLRAAAAGATRIDARLRHGDLVDTAVELQPGAALLVVGSPAGTDGRRHGDDPVDRIVRTASVPVLVAAGDGFAGAPARAVVVADGALPAKSAAAIAAHPLAAGLPVAVVAAAADTPATRRELADARSRLAAAGVAVESVRVDGDAALAAFVASRSPALVVAVGGGRDWLGRRRAALPAAVARLRGVPVLVLR